MLTAWFAFSAFQKHIRYQSNSKKADHLLKPIENVFHLSKCTYNNPNPHNDNANKCQRQHHLCHFFLSRSCPNWGQITFFCISQKDLGRLCEASCLACYVGSSNNAAWYLTWKAERSCSGSLYGFGPWVAISYWLITAYTVFASFSDLLYTYME